MSTTIIEIKHLPIDDTDSIYEEFENSFIKCNTLSSNNILFHGDSGCGKSMLRKRCIDSLKNKWEDKTEYVDLSDFFRQSINSSSEDKTSELIDAIVYELKRKKSYKERDFPEGTNNLKVRELNNVFVSLSKLLVIIFPPIKIWPELDGFYKMFSSSSSILVFETDNDDVVRNAKNVLATRLVCYKVNNLKVGDGKLFLSTYRDEDPNIVFDEEIFEASISERIRNGGMTISQIVKLHSIVYNYAKRENIGKVTKNEIADALMNIIQ